MDNTVEIVITRVRSYGEFGAKQTPFQRALRWCMSTMPFERHGRKSFRAHMRQMSIAARIMVAENCCAWHATHKTLATTIPCPCCPCAVARGEMK